MEKRMGKDTDIESKPCMEQQNNNSQKVICPRRNTFYILNKVA
jgi:hypothetical protein